MNDTSDDTAKRVDYVLSNLRTVLLDDRMGTHGHPGLFAHAFSDMLRTYHGAVQATGRRFDDTDGLITLEIMKIARRACMPANPNPEAEFAHAEDAGGYAILRAAYSLPPAVVAGLYAENASAAEDGSSALKENPIFMAGYAAGLHDGRLEGVAEEKTESDEARRDRLEAQMRHNGEIDALDSEWLLSKAGERMTSASDTAWKAAVDAGEEAWDKEVRAEAETRVSGDPTPIRGVSEAVARTQYRAEALNRAEEDWTYASQLITASQMTAEDLADPGNVWPFVWGPHERELVRRYLVSRGLMQR